MPPEAGLHAEETVVDQWREQMLDAQRGALSDLLAPDAETLAVADATIEDAVRGLGCDDGDLLVLGASSAGAAASRVLLGDPGGAVLRAAPVPVVLSPGATTL